MPRMKVSWSVEQVESDVFKCPYDIVGVVTPSVSGVAGPYTLKASDFNDVAPTAKTVDGSAMPDLVEDDTVALGTFGDYPYWTLTAGGGSPRIGDYVWIKYRDFIR